MQSVPKELLTLTNMILHGPDIESQSDGMSQASMSIARLLLFNSSVKRRSNSKQMKHSLDRESRLPIFVGLTVHAKTHRRDLVDILFQLGISVSYDRVMDIIAGMGNQVCQHYLEKNVVCPINLKHGLFTTAAVDNIDHNPSSSTATGSFHGTGLSLIQNISRGDVSSKETEKLEFQLSNVSQKCVDLPESYTVIPPSTVSRRKAASSSGLYFCTSRKSSECHTDSRIELA